MSAVGFAARTSTRVYGDARTHRGIAIEGVIRQAREEAAKANRDDAD